MRKGAIIMWLLACFVGMIALFWHYEWVYALPTPIPKNYRLVKQGELIDLDNKIKFSSKPVFLHFFNPDCPCSRFNMTHFRSLVREYGNEVEFKMIVMTGATEKTAKSIQEKYGLDIPVLYDSAIAAACGVYSTPQAVIIEPGGRLYYRGNYNKSRYCTEKKSNYAQIALAAMIQERSKPVFGRDALTAYGCQLPECSKQRKINDGR
jgi:peroxiredoxin